MYAALLGEKHLPMMPQPCRAPVGEEGGKPEMTLDHFGSLMRFHLLDVGIMLPRSSSLAILR
jgi:hypothetical protein